MSDRVRPHRPRLVAALVLLLWCLLVALPAPAAAQDDEDEPAPTPTATLSNGVGAPGDTVEVLGKDWPAQTVVQVQLCGNQNLNGSIDCLRTNAVTKAADEEGRFSATLVVGTPPAPCPCVISTATFDGQFPLDLPYEVTGAPTAPPSQAESQVPDFRLTGTEVTDGPSFGARLGLADTRTLVTTVVNRGTIPIAVLPITVTFGRGDDPSRVVASTEVTDLGPGEDQQVELELPVDALSAGSYTAVVTAGTGPRAVTDAVTLSTFPWLLVLLVVVLAIVGASLLFARLSRSRRAEPPPVSGDPPPEGGGFDPRALEADLAAEVHAALVAAGPGGRPDVVADRIAPAIAATLAARHGLDEAQAASLEDGLRQELADQLGRAEPAGAGTAAP